MKIFLSVALWGHTYARTFAEYSLASMLSPSNIPQLTKRHNLTYHIVTTRKDGAWLKQQPGLQILSQHTEIEWDFLEDLGYDPWFIPVGVDGAKYSFLSVLQNLAIRKSLAYDALVFNYADFIWADGSLSNAIDLLKDGIDGVLSFCLPVDRISGMEALDELRAHASPRSPILSIPPRSAADIAIRCLHREAKLRYWDGPLFSGTPTYLLWPVGKEGVIVRAFHQTILVIRVKPDDPIYAGGNPGLSLDGYFSSMLADTGKVAHADNSDEVIAFSLYDTHIDTRLIGGRTREESLRECLRGTVSEGQRKFARVPIEVRRSHDNPEAWKRVARESLATLEYFHDTTAFDPVEYRRLYTTHESGIEPLGRWRRKTAFRILFLFYRRGLLRFASGRGGRVLKDIIGPTAARALRLIFEHFIYGRRASVSAAGKTNPFKSSSASLIPTVLRALWLASPARNQLHRGRRIYDSGMRALFSGRSGALVERMLGRDRANALKISAKALITPQLELAPGIRVSGRSVLAIQACTSMEEEIARISDLKELNRILSRGATELRAATEQVPLWAEGHRALGRNYWFQGRFKEALDCFREGELCAAKVAKANGWDPDAAVLLPRNCNHVIGLMGHIDAFVKYKILMGDPRPYYLLSAPGEAVNRTFLDYWSDYITIVSDKGEIERLAKLEAAYSVNWNWVLPDEQEEIVHVHRGIARIQRQWEQEGRGALLKLKPAHMDLLERQLAAWGLTKGDWFVCLHVRSSGYYAEKVGTPQHFRNTPIEDYYPLIQSIVEQGGWVIRMGDPLTPPLNFAALGKPGSRVIDYAHKPERSPELDVALSASCRLFVSSPSGLHTVAHAFGRPVCPVNFPIYAGFPWHAEEIFIPQRYFSRLLGRVLTAEELLSSDVPHRDHHFLLEMAGLELLHNKPNDLVEVVREALNPSAYTVEERVTGHAVVKEFDRLNHFYKADISGRLGLHFAATYAHELCPSLAQVPVPASDDVLESAAAQRKLDVLIPSFNRPALLYHCLSTGLSLQIPGMVFVVFDDGSNLVENVPSLGAATTAQVCASFRTKRVVYIRNPENMGVAATWQHYYRHLCTATYTMSVTDKDEFINAAPIASALAKMDADPKVSMVIIPMRQKDRADSDRAMLFDYRRMSGREYLARYVEDTMLQHCSMWGIMRTEAARRAGVPRPIGLRRYGLDDGFGIDIDFVFMVAVTGDVEFEREPHVRRSTLAGGTEKFPLTFAYTYYQYAKRAMAELRDRGLVSETTRRRYLGWWLLLIARGLIVAYQPVHGTELERGTERIRRHLPLPILLYLPVEALKYRIRPNQELITLYWRAVGIMAKRWLIRWKRGAVQLS